MAKASTVALALLCVVGLVALHAHANEPADLSASELDALAASGEKHEFQAEVSRLMSIIINSLYSNKEVFAREALSNAADALSKTRVLSLQNPELLADDSSPLRITIRADRESKLLHITDNGIGMTRNDLVTHLGTIASSGTKQFMEQLSKSSADASSSLIGQFGVGFYSYFLVSDKVVVTTKHHDDEQYIWESDARSGYTVARDPRGNTLGRGTRITLHLTEENEYLLDQSALERIVQKYSEFIDYPIFLWASEEVDVEVPLTEEEIEAAKAAKAAAKAEDEEVENLDGDDSDDEAAAAAADDEEEVATTKTVKETKWDWRQLNPHKPIWARKPEDLTEEDYNRFYAAISKEKEDPLAYTHFGAEGDVEFQSILYIPLRAPQSMFDPNGAKDMARRIKLYVRRVFITDDLDDMIPRYLQFMTGMVDSLDMPLNVGREILQQDRTLAQIKRKLVRKAIALVQEISSDTEKYTKFWKQFGANIKMGVLEDRENKQRLSKLLRFYSTKSGEEFTSLEEYVERFRDGQKEIYYVAADSKEAAAASPLIERLVRNGYEVLLGTDPIDEYTLNNLEKFDSFKVVNVAKDDFKFPGNASAEDKEHEAEVNAEFSSLTIWMRKIVPRNVEKVVVSHRLSTTPMAVAAAGPYGLSANMQRISAAQALQDRETNAMMREFFEKKQLEINPRHPLIKELNERVKLDPEDESTKRIAQLLYETALLHSGYPLDSTPVFADHVVSMLQKSLGLDENARAEPEPLVADAAPADDASASDDKAEL